MSGPVQSSTVFRDLIGEPGEAQSLHQRILGDIRDRILSGQWPPGHRIPSEVELAGRFGCSRMTVNKVLTQLARAGLIERRRKAGSFVARPRAQSALLEILDIKSEVQALGLAYRLAIRSRRQRHSTSDDRARLGLTEKVPLLALDCLHFAGARPFCLERRLINLAAVPAAAHERFEDLAPGPWLIAHVPWTEAEHRIRAVVADAESAAALAIAPDAACLVIERRTWSMGATLTHVCLTYPGAGRELVARFTPSRG